MGDWEIGRLEDWKIGGLENWRVGGLEGWRVESWGLSGGVVYWLKSCRLQGLCLKVEDRGEVRQQGT